MRVKNRVIYEYQTRRKVSLKPRNVDNVTGRVLFSYLRYPFLVSSKSPYFTQHTCIWECVDMVTAFLELGYRVDVIDWKDNKFTPQNLLGFLILILSIL